MRTALLFGPHFANVIAAAVIEGHAAGPVQQLLVNDELVQGRLVHILPDYEVKPTEALLTYLSVRLMRPVIRAFIASPFSGTSYRRRHRERWWRSLNRGILQMSAA